MDAGKREIELIRLLGKADRPLRLDAVAASLNVSEKTIRRDLRRQIGRASCRERVF